jgi:transcriptional regulator with XRE-family HTH domain
MFAFVADAWRDRLAAAIEASGKSQREISLAAGLGPGYVNSIFNDGKEPSVDRLMRVCRSLNVSIYYILGGFDINPETEEFLRLLVRADSEECPDPPAAGTTFWRKSCKALCLASSLAIPHSAMISPMSCIATPPPLRVLSLFS